MNETMRCEKVRELMLEAELDELRGIGESAVAAHVRECERCAAYANRILDSYQTIDTGLAAIRPTAADIIPLRKRRTLRWLSAPLAAAAVIALLMAIPQDEPLPDVNGVARLMFGEAPIIAPRTGQQAMVIQKNEMTIVWLYQQETR